MSDDATWAARERLATTSPDLIAAIVALADEYGMRGVLQTAEDIMAGWAPFIEAATEDQ